jgi:hypothetical protein
MTKLLERGIVYNYCMITVEQLFAEEFTPVWLARKRELVKESYRHATSAAIDLQYRLNAYDSARRIAAKWPPKKPL